MNCPRCGKPIDEHEAGTCMDAWVAKTVMGLNISHLGVVWEEGYMEDGMDGWDGFVCPRCKTPESMLDKVPCAKHYSTDISAAWEVVERFRKGDYSHPKNITVACVIEMTVYDGVSHEDCGVRIYSPTQSIVDAYANEMSLAICRAALRACAK